jgi:hypothetical protein
MWWLAQRVLSGVHLADVLPLLLLLLLRQAAC